MDEYRLVLTLWEPDGGDRQLLDACAAALRRAKATVTETIGLPRPTFLLGRYPAFGPPGEKVQVRAARLEPGPGGLVQFELPYDYLDRRRDGWAEFHRAVAGLLADVRPQLVTVTAEIPADELPDPPPGSADLLFRAGWVDPARLDSARQAAFGAALRHGSFAEIAAGWWWSAQPELDPAGRGRGDPEALSRAMYAAWTTRPAGAAEASGTADAGGTIRADDERADDERGGEERAGAGGAVEPAPAPELWFWAADRADDVLLGQVRAWAGREGIEPERVRLGSLGEPGWVPVVVELGGDPPSWERFDEQAAAGLALLRRAVPEVRPSWAALQLTGGFLVPGDDPQTPAAATLPNVWVSSGWLHGAERDRLLGTLAGAHREDLAGGILLVTTSAPLPADDLAPWCHDRDEWWTRVVDAAAILGTAARASRP